jgi:thiol-disulfide isomerase/thioredoxin
MGFGPIPAKGNSMRRKWTLRVLTLGLAAFMLGLAAAPAGAAELDDERSPNVKVVGKALKASDDVGNADDPAIGKKVPRLKGLSLDGEKITFKSDGTPRILVFLSHSCPHCQAEVPRIVELAEDGQLEGVEIDTVTTNTTKQLPNWPPSDWLEEESWPFSPVLADDDDLSAFFGFGGEAFPYFVAVDADGRVAGRASGELDPDVLAEVAQRLAAGQSLFE